MHLKLAWKLQKGTLQMLYVLAQSLGQNWSFQLAYVYMNFKLETKLLFPFRFSIPMQVVRILSERADDQI